MEVFLIRVLQFILAISLLVFLHEGGHFFFAKLFGVRVDKFYIFFDWKFSLFKFKPKNSDTEYGIGWIPLGGYCKIAGMIDESFDTEQMKQPEQPWEFRTKPTWQRLLIMIGGVLVNFLLALFIYSQILFWWGDSYRFVFCLFFKLIIYCIWRRHEKLFAYFIYRAYDNAVFCVSIPHNLWR